MTSSGRPCNSNKISTKTQQANPDGPGILPTAPHHLLNAFPMVNPFGGFRSQPFLPSAAVDPQAVLLQQGAALMGGPQNALARAARITGEDGPLFSSAAILPRDNADILASLLHDQQAEAVLGARSTRLGSLGSNGSYAQVITGGASRQESRGRCTTLYMPADEEMLSDHQCLLRKQIEFFEADIDDVEIVTPGRRKEVVLGQVGVRCKHCAWVPVRQRTKGAVYYPAKLKGLYQAAQNMAVSHFCEACQNIDPFVQAQLRAYNEAKSTSGHGGKQYWADGARILGVMETEDGRLRFDPSRTIRNRSRDSMKDEN